MALQQLLEDVLPCAFASARRRARGCESPTVTWSTSVFAVGVPSRTEVSVLSGRGVGLAAMRAACEAELGSVYVETRVGGGTRLVFRCRCPMVRIDRAEARGRRWSLARRTQVPLDRHRASEKRTPCLRSSEHARVYPD